MKLSLQNPQRSDQGFIFCTHPSLSVRLDGITCLLCVEANEEEGYVIVYKNNADTILKDNYDILYGHVHILHGDRK